MQKWVTLGKTGSQFEKRVTLGRMGHSGKMGNTYKTWITLEKNGQGLNLKNGSDLEKWVTPGKMNHT